MDSLVRVSSIPSQTPRRRPEFLPAWNISELHFIPETAIEHAGPVLQSDGMANCLSIRPGAH
jgi:hypothetical protein